jgi:hypothetical protein
MQYLPLPFTFTLVQYLQARLKPAQVEPLTGPYSLSFNRAEFETIVTIEVNLIIFVS